MEGTEKSRDADVNGRTWTEETDSHGRHGQTDRTENALGFHRHENPMDRNPQMLGLRQQDPLSPFVRWVRVNPCGPSFVRRVNGLGGTSRIYTDDTDKRTERKNVLGFHGHENPMHRNPQMLDLRQQDPLSPFVRWVRVNP